MTKTNAKQIETAIAELSAMPEHDWQIAQNLWARGSSWTAFKRGSRWFAANNFALPAGFTTKASCCDAMDQVICSASRIRRALQDAA